MDVYTAPHGPFSARIVLRRQNLISKDDSRSEKNVQWPYTHNVGIQM